MRLIPRDNNLGWTPFAWTIYILPFALTPLYMSKYANAAGWLTFVPTSIAFLALYFRSYWVRGRELILVALATAALGVAFWPLTQAAGCFFIYSAAMFGMLEPSRHAVRGVAAIAVLVLVNGWLIERHWFPITWAFVFTIIVGAINVHFCEVSRSNARLRLAQDEIEHLAKVAERERIARDLHDLLGHTLSLVILKSELASKLAERDAERARDEIRDVERIARDALAQVRSAVAGYRSDGLQSEVEHARKALSTAGVALDCDVAPMKLPAAQEAVLAMALREAVTNIVRHSGARRCRIALAVTDASATLTIADDGRGGNAPFGNGLTGMRERVDILGGSLTREGRGGTTLTVTLPTASPTAKAEIA